MPHDDPLDSPTERRKGCLLIIGSLLAAALVTLAITGLLAWRTTLSITDHARELSQSVAATFKHALNLTPEVRINSVVVVEASKEVKELVILKKQALVQYRWSETWLHSTKQFEIEATFTAQAGFDLAEPFRVQIDPVTFNIEANLPPPTILSISMGDVRVLRDEDGLWNKLTPEDRTRAFHELERKARTQFVGSTLLAETRNAAEKSIREILADAGKEIDFAPTQRLRP
jgi:hypothetical protein